MVTKNQTNIQKIIKRILPALLITILLPGIATSKPVIFTNTFDQDVFNKQVEILVDPYQTLLPTNILTRGKFNSSLKSSIFFLNQKALWGRFTVTNNSTNSSLFFSVQYSNISKIELYRVNEKGQLSELVKSGTDYKFSSRLNNYVNFNFDLHLPQGETGTYYFKIISQHPVELQMSLFSQGQLNGVHSLQSIIMAAFLGVMIAILLYNLFLFFATADKSYIIYVFFLIALVAAQFTLEGWSFKYFWPDSPGINKYAVICTSCLTGVAAIVFAISFLRTSTYLPNTHRLLLALMGVEVFSFLMSFTPLRIASYQILNISATISGIILIYVSAAIYLKGYRPALYYLFAWSSFLVGLIILVSRNVGLLPTNMFTTHVVFMRFSHHRHSFIDRTC